MFSLGIAAPDWAFDCDLRRGIESAGAVGVEGIEFFGWEDTDVDAVLETAEAAGVEVFGTLAAGAGSTIADTEAPAVADPADTDEAIADIERSIVVASEAGMEHVVVTVGQALADVPDARQHEAIVEVLDSVAPTAEAEDISVVIEPLNTRVDHPGYYLTTSQEAAEIVHAVDSPNVGMLFDVYHQQVTEGDVVRRLREHAPVIEHVHIADNPGRHEPGTGELDYGFILEAIADLDYDGWVACEFGPVGDPSEVYPQIVAMADAARERASNTS